MKFITAEEASKKWEIGLRTVQRMCASGKIEGAEKISNVWMIPEFAKPYSDKKTKNKVSKEEIVEAYNCFLFDNFDKYISFYSKEHSCKSQITKAYYCAVESYRCFPKIDKMAAYWNESKKFLNNTNSKIPEISLTMGSHFTLGIFLYKKGIADKVSKLISENLPVFEYITGHKSGLDLLFQAELAYQRGNVREAELLGYKALFLHDNDPDIKSGISSILAHIALHKGDIKGWNTALEMMDSIINSCENELTKMSVEIAKAELLLSAQKVEEIPDWLKKFDFTGKKLTVTSRVNALFVHLSYLWRNKEYARAIAFSDMLIENSGQYYYTSSYSMLYLYIIMALCYHKLFMDNSCIKYIKKAIEIAKADELYLPFSDYANLLDGVSDAFLKENEPEIYEKVAKIKEGFTDNYKSIISLLKASDLSASLSDREKEISWLVAEGLSNAEIAEKLYISKSTVNYHIRNIFSKLGVNKRSMMIKHLYFNDK